MNISALADETLRHPFVETLGWALLHFVWQGAFVSLLVCVVLLLMRRASANARYLLACGGLLVMAALPAVTMAMLPDRETSTGAASNPREVTESPVQLPTNNAASGAVPIVSSSILPVDVFTIPVDGTDTGTPIESKFALAVSAPPPPLAKRCEMFLRPWLPSMIVVWLVGVVALAMRLLLTWVQVRWLETCGVLPTEPEHLRLMQQLATRLGVRRAVRLLESSLVEVPTVIGWLKPVILLPIASVNSLTVSQLEAILAHEMAHIRRADYAVNLLQSLIETLLFYHPAVWWISSRIRQEREHCCDDLAASISGDTAGYVAALVRMEELRCEPRMVAVAARGGNLLSRVRRLLIPVAPDASFRDRVSPWWLTGAAALLIVGALIGLPVLSKSQAEPVVVQETSRQLDHEKKPAKDAKENAANAKDPGVVVAPLADDDLDNITPSQIADRIEAAWKKYESIEYTATVEETRNTNWMFPKEKPEIVNGTGSIMFRTDGTCWFADEKSFSYNQSTSETYPIQKISAFDGETHQIYDHRSLILGQDEFAPNRLTAPEFFWQAGISTDWLIIALRRPEAKLVERIKMAETSCLHVEVKWKPDWETADRSFDIMICPEQGWLPRRVIIERGGEMQAEWSISEVATTESGLVYPVEFETKRPVTDTIPLRRVTINSFHERKDFTSDEFVIAPQLGMNIVDYRQGISWHNDPWWNELLPWMREHIDRPQPDLQPLDDLRSNSEQELAGKDAPPIVSGDWLTEPAPLDWDRPERKVTVQHFYGGLLIEPSPKQLKALDHLQRRYRDGGLEVIGITTNDKFRERFGQAVKELNLSFPVMIDNKASDADIASKKSGAEWGATFVSYRLKPYTGTVVIDGDGKLQLVDPNTRNLPSGMSHIESLVRDALVKANGTADSPHRRHQLVNHASMMLRGTAASANEIAAAISDRSPLWLQNSLQSTAAELPEVQQNLVMQYGDTIEDVVGKLKNGRLVPSVAHIRLGEEWKRRTAIIDGRAAIHGRIRKRDGHELLGCEATIIAEPVFYFDDWSASFDQSRRRQIDSHANREFAMGKLTMGTYQMTIAAPGKARVMWIVHLADDNSKVEVDIELIQDDVISGKVVNAAGELISNARVTAVRRPESVEHAIQGRFAPRHLSEQRLSTNESGDFAFERLFEGSYLIKVTADGYETATTEPQPAGTTDVRVILKPKA
jgi:beta-lactamase regulating signal transducer with metallopeptidase domain/peroxiredoxin